MVVTTQLKTAKGLEKLRLTLVEQRKSKRLGISVCSGTGCRAHGSMELVEEFRRQLDAKGLTDVEVRATGCHGFCERGPLVVIFPQKIFYQGVQIKNVDSVIEQTILNRIGVRMPATTSSP